MKKTIASILATATLLGTVSVAAAEEVKAPALPNGPVSSSTAGGSISVQSDRQGPFIVGITENSSNRQATTPQVNGRNRSGSYSITMESGSTGISAVLLQSNGGAWTEVPNSFIEVNVTSPSLSKTKSVTMKSGYSYKVKLSVGTGHSGSASIKNF
ncbi:hypothetical protein [Saccharibacillus sp. O23]|uniref:hypothetical protein n=1 Tax=Saccharibacillus sp. O23 TaxID=2009338 RepID=UPI000B4E63C1|nr:hypothetical protein [Saccharibacillus sp. O23]